MTVPYSFANATVSIPLSQLDSNFNTPITLGNTAIQLGNTVTTLNNMTMANVTISSVSTPITVAQGGTGLVTITANAVVLGNGTGSVTSVSPGTTGNVLTSSGTTWVSQAPSGGTPGGSNTQVQFNNSGAFGGSSAFTWDGAQIQVNGITVGRGAGAVSTNTAVGASALAANTSGGANVALGQQALLTNITGNDNTALGRRALYFSTASNNTAVGSEALISNTSGGSNTAVGAFSLSSNTTASNNTAVGYQAAYTNSTGADNVAVGHTALRQNTTGSSNVAIGYAPLFGNTTGVNNVAIGLQALVSNTTASNNTAVGYQAGYSNTTGAYNIFIGHQAGYTSNSGSNNGNTAIGVQAGYSLTTGTGNTFVGPASSSSGFYVTTGSKNTILGGYNGNQGGLDIRTANNYIVLSDGDGNPRGYFNNNGSFIISSSTANRLSVYSGATNPASSGAAGQGLNLGYDNNTEVCWIQGNRNNASETRTLQLNPNGGEVYVAGTTDQGAYNLQCNGTGVWGAGAYVNGSDERIKDEIAPITSGLDVVAKLNPVTYRYKEDWSKDQSTQTGFIAQELLVALEGQNYVDGVVQKNGSAEYYSVAYQNIIPILTKAIQELKSELDSVKAELNTLKGA